MTTALIADDEPLLAQALAERLQTLWPQLDIVAIAKNGLEASAEINRLQPDLAFLDIRMPGMTGLQVAGALQNTRVVFVTAFDEYAVAAFENNAVDYLLKPVSDLRLAQCVAKLQRTQAKVPDLSTLLQQLNQRQAVSSTQYLTWLTTGLADTTRLVSCDEVIYFQACEKYTEIITATERHLIRTSLKELLPQLNPQRFAQIHRSYIVCLSQIDKIDRDLLGRQRIHLKLKADILPLSRSHAGQFKQM
ncbi:response regulator transcription factor [Chitinibacter bivalviorum]|uniref:Response regulator transcription factor n=1 Tax=Chitinibacter bivalviorum TaxID=2739434 RepID=A0A7H9BHQ1_9NEIS|nr:LytTR family DNA-binding domain-containing protein [Chitinibacter bivalviorum]QLG88069.1 response regulator transcription factor [Chitinibacter bivalviorum]